MWFIAHVIISLVFIELHLHLMGKTTNVVSYQIIFKHKVEISSIFLINYEHQ
jgi:hypothetical protein